MPIVEKVENKEIQAGNKIEEFLAYDEKGNPVVLRRSASMASKEASATNFGMAAKRETQARPTGSMRFFAGFEEVKARLRAKSALS